jgi:hypothetical protein
MNGETRKRERKNVTIREAEKWEKKTRRQWKEGQGTEGRKKGSTER